MLRIKAGVTEDKQAIKIQVANSSFSRVVKILEFEIYYGSMPDYKQFVLRAPIEPVTLKESDTFDFSIDTAALKAGAITHKVVQKYYSVLWVKVITAISGSPLQKITLPEKYFPDNLHLKAEKYMATDDLLGFPPLKPVYNNPYNIRTR